MAVVLKLVHKGDVQRLRLDAAPTYEFLDEQLRDIFPFSSGCGSVRYSDEEGDACLLTKATFADFLETARSFAGGACPVLRLEVLPEAAYENSWCCVDGSEGSWVCTGGSLGGTGSDEAEFEPLAADLSEPRANDGGDSGDGAEFEPLAVDLSELHANDWGSSAADTSESEEHLAATPPGTPDSTEGATVDAAAIVAADVPVPRWWDLEAGLGELEVKFEQQKQRKERRWSQRRAGMDAVVHMGHICDGCEACPLPGPRFTCRVCSDFDLCSACWLRRGELHDPAHLFQQVLWSAEVARACPGGCGYGVTKGHATHCCAPCAEGRGQHTDACHSENAHDDEL